MEGIIFLISLVLVLCLAFKHGYERGFERGWDAKCEACKQMHEEEGENKDDH